MNLKKIIALVLCVCMVLSFFPVSVFAEEWDDDVILEEEYYEPQEEYYEEEIIDEEPVDYSAPVEEIFFEDEDVLVEEEPAAEELVEEPAAEEPAAPAEEPAAAEQNFSMEAAESFAADDPTKPVAYVGYTPYFTFEEALAAVRMVVPSACTRASAPILPSTRKLRLTNTTAPGRTILLIYPARLRLLRMSHSELA